jgi:hypothetical protein
MGWRKLLVIVIGVIVIVLALTVKSNPFAYCGYCQYERSEMWKPRNVYPCSFRRYVFTSNSSDISLYMNAPGG